MADLVLTASTVKVKSGTTPQLLDITLGETVTQGEIVYLDSTDNEYKLADSTSAAKAGSGGIGITLGAGSDGQPCRILTQGIIELTTTPALTVGDEFWLSDTAGAGAFAPKGDIATGGTNYLTLVAVAIATNELEIKPWVTGVLLP